MERNPMQKLNDLSRSLTPLKPDGTLIAVIEMSLSSWLVAGIVPGIERQPLKKLDVDENALLKLLNRWREEAQKAGQGIERIAVAFEAGRDGFWLARWLRTRDIEAHIIHASSVAVSREHRRAKTDRLVAGRQRDRLGDAKAGRVDRDKQRSHLKIGNRLQESHDLVARQNRRQRVCLAPERNMLGHICLPERGAVEESYRTHDWDDGCGLQAAPDEMQLIGSHILQGQFVRRSAKVFAEVLHGADVSCLRIR